MNECNSFSLMQFSDVALILRCKRSNFGYSFQCRESGSGELLARFVKTGNPEVFIYIPATSNELSSVERHFQNSFGRICNKVSGAATA